MKTDDFVSMLATRVAARADPAIARWRFVAALGAGLLLSALLVSTTFGIRPDLATVAATAPLWWKLGFAVCIAIGAGVATWHLAAPGRRVGWAWAVLLVPVALAWLAAGASLWHAAPAARWPMIAGQSWRSCPFNIALLSLPVFVCTLWAVREGAPTRPRAAGAAAGLLAGALGTIAYCLHCTEMAVTFWALWYVLGMLVPTVVGAWLGPRLLRW